MNMYTIKSKTFHYLAAALLGLLFCLLLGATPAHALDDTYHSGYDYTTEGYVDLMKYITNITTTLNGVDYSQADLQALADKGTPLTRTIGDKITFNFRFSVNGRAYDANDRTLLDEGNSTKVVYTHDTEMLDGTKVTAGSEAILDDSSLLKANTTKESTYIRIDISWLINTCGSNINIEYASNSSNLALYQDGTYLYVYFPNGIGNTYANDGWFSITSTLTKTFETIVVPGTPGYYVPGTDWTFKVISKEDSQESYSGNISAYGRIMVNKVWKTDDANHGPAKIVLNYTQGGEAKTATRSIAGDGSASFYIADDMSDCKISEDMTGLDGYVSNLTVSEDGRTYTFTNAKEATINVSKKTTTGSDELPGATISLIKINEDGSQTEVENWVSGTSPHQVTLPAGSYILHETAAPLGYAVTTDIPFTVNSDMTVTSTNNNVNGNDITLLDAALEVKFAKVDEKGAAVTGAVLTLTDSKTGNLVEKWTTDANPYTITYAGSNGEILVAGHTYVLHEESAPAGYQLADDVSFVFNGDGTISHCPYHVVTMVDKLIPVATATPAPTSTPAPAITPAPDSVTTGGSTSNPTSSSTVPDNNTPAEDTPSTNNDTPADNAPTGGTTGGPAGGVATGNSSNSVSTGSSGIVTGDSPVMWVFLVLAIICILVAAALIVITYLRKKNDK